MLGYGVKETTTTTGTGTLTLSSVSGFPRFSNAFAVGDVVEYSILNSAGEPLECGIGTVGSSNTLARTFPLTTYTGGTYSNNAPSALSLSAGTYTVICTGSPGAGYPFIPGLFSGSNKVAYSAHITGPLGSNCPMTANRLYMTPFLLTANRPLAGIGCRITTGAGTSGTLGFYRCTADGQPGALLQSGTINTASSATVRTVSFSAYYPPGWYFMGLVCDNAPSIQSSTSYPLMSPLGCVTAGGIITALYTANGSITLPDPYNPSGHTLVGDVAYPCPWVIYA